MIGILRRWMVAVLCLGIVLPRASAVLSELSPLAASRIVICTGYGLETILQDTQGNPIEGQSSQQQHCTLCHAVLCTAEMSADWARIA